MSYLYTKVVVSRHIMGEQVKGSYEEVPIAIHIPSIMAFYARTDDDEDIMKVCERRRSNLIMRDGTEYYTPLTFEQVKSIIDPSGGGNNYQPQNSPYSPTVLTPSI